MDGTFAEFAPWNELERHGTLDPSQIEALKAALTREIALIQGPPGTGKRLPFLFAF